MVAEFVTRQQNGSPVNGETPKQNHLTSSILPMHGSINSSSSLVTHTTQSKRITHSPALSLNGNSNESNSGHGMMLSQSPMSPLSPSHDNYSQSSYDMNLKRKDLFTQRKQREFIPDNKKDDSYWDRRRRNNEAAKRSREKRRYNDMVLEQRVVELTKENHVLKAQLDAIRDKFNISGENLVSVDQILATLPTSEQVLSITKRAKIGNTMTVPSRIIYPNTPSPVPSVIHQNLDANIPMAIQSVSSSPESSLQQQESHQSAHHQQQYQKQEHQQLQHQQQPYHQSNQIYNINLSSHSLHHYRSTNHATNNSTMAQLQNHYHQASHNNSKNVNHVNGNNSSDSEINGTVINNNNEKNIYKCDNDNYHFSNETSINNQNDNCNNLSISLSNGNRGDENEIMSNQQNNQYQTNLFNHENSDQNISNNNKSSYRNTNKNSDNNNINNNHEYHKVVCNVRSNSISSNISANRKTNVCNENSNSEPSSAKKLLVVAAALATNVFYNSSNSEQTDKPQLNNSINNTTNGSNGVISTISNINDYVSGTNGSNSHGTPSATANNVSSDSVLNLSRRTASPYELSSNGTGSGHVSADDEHDNDLCNHQLSSTDINNSLPLKLRHKSHLGDKDAATALLALQHIKQEPLCRASPPWDCEGSSDERDSGISIGTSEWALLHHHNQRKIIVPNITVAAASSGSNSASNCNSLTNHVIAATTLSSSVTNNGVEENIHLKSQIARLESEVASIKNMMILGTTNATTTTAPQLY